jgi:hypothetical protein
MMCRTRRRGLRFATKVLSVPVNGGSAEVKARGAGRGAWGVGRGALGGDAECQRDRRNKGSHGANERITMATHM